MQFFSTLTITALFAATMSMAIAIPAPVEAGLAIEKRTCGTLTGTALSVCQTACKAACSVGTLGLASKACKAACDAPPL